MDELICPECAAVCPPDISEGLCPSCGYVFGTPSQRIWPSITNSWVLLFVAVWGLLVFQSGGPLLVVVIGIFLAVAWTIFTQPGLERSLRSHSDGAPRVSVPLSKPAMPDEWQFVSKLPRPRNVYLPPTAKLWIFLECAIFFAVGGVLLWYEVKTFIVESSFRWEQPLIAIWFVLWIRLFGLARLRDLKSVREMLRDGELTPGLVTTWQRTRFGTHLTYQFWNDAGQKLEASARLHAYARQIKITDPLQVYYLSDEPKRNVALCCTPLRIRSGTRI
jgi:hypothetical protein